MLSITQIYACVCGYFIIAITISYSNIIYSPNKYLLSIHYVPRALEISFLRIKRITARMCPLCYIQLRHAVQVLVPSGLK